MNICHPKRDRITNMGHIKRTIALIAVTAILWSSCQCDDTKKKKIPISNLCCRNHNLMCGNLKTDENQLSLCIQTELEMAQYGGKRTFCKEFLTFCEPGATIMPMAPREATTIHSPPETDYAAQRPSTKNKNPDCEDPTNGVSVPVIVLVAILMFLLGSFGMLTVTCFTYPLWKSWKICGPFHSCLSHDTYIDSFANKSNTAVTNRTKNNPTYHESNMANNSVESCIYDSPRDSTQGDQNPLYSVGTQEITNSVTDKQDGKRDINPGQYELLNESKNSNSEHKYSCIQTEPYNHNPSELTSGTLSTDSRKGNHEYFEVEAHNKLATSGS